MHVDVCTSHAKRATRHSTWEMWYFKEIIKHLSHSHARPEIVSARTDSTINKFTCVYTNTYIYIVRLVTDRMIILPSQLVLGHDARSLAHKKIFPRLAMLNRHSLNNNNTSSINFNLIKIQMHCVILSVSISGEFM